MVTDAQQFQRIFDVSHETFERLVIYENILQTWQKRMNLVGATSLAHFWHRHVMDSAQLLHHLPHYKPISCWLDLGSGAGFPGLVIAIISNIKTHLIESVGKKCEFLHAVVDATDAPVDIHHTRLENFAPNAPCDIISARALAPLPRLLPQIACFFDSSTIALLHKGQNWQNELTEAQRYWTFAYETHVSITNDKARIIKLMNPIAKNIIANAQL